MVRAAVVGATGYTGFELVRILLNHPGARIALLTSRSESEKDLAALYPSLRGGSPLKISTFDPRRIAAEADVAFTALPHGASAEAVGELIDQGVRVIDLSADFRFRSLETYRQWYGNHPREALLTEAVYGLPELHREEIKGARLVGNPGCYPTSAILPLYPLLAEGIIARDTVVVNSASGVSGAGRAATAGNIFCEVNEGFKAYKVGEHRHTPEIEEVLSLATGGPIVLTFTPHLLPLNRGILSTITATLEKRVTTEEVLSLLERYYGSEPFVRICPPGSYPDVAAVRGSNFCDMGARVDARTGRLIVLSAIDNLVKGASGQAVQNMNLMFGLHEREGLKGLPLAI